MATKTRGHRLPDALENSQFRVKTALGSERLKVFVNIKSKETFTGVSIDKDSVISVSSAGLSVVPTSEKSYRTESKKYIFWETPMIELQCVCMSKDCANKRLHIIIECDLRKTRIQMASEFPTPTALCMYLRNTDPDERLTYLEQIFHTLYFVTRFPAYTGTCGIAWFSNTMIVCHTRLFANFLGVNAKEVRLSMKMYTFSFHGYYASFMATHPVPGPPLPDVQNWKLWTCKLFTKGTTLHEIQDNPNIVHSTFSHQQPTPRYKVPRSEISLATEWYTNATRRKMSEFWETFAGKKEVVRVTTVVAKLMEFVEPTTTGAQRQQINCNLQYLISKNENVQIDLKKFITFSLRYGIAANAVENIISLTVFPRAVDSEVVPRFVSWFQPESNKELAARDLITTHLKWMVTENDKALDFSVHFVKSSIVHTTTIRYDALYHCFSTDFSTEQAIRKPSLKEILTDVLHLREEAEDDVGNSRSYPTIRITHGYTMRCKNLKEIATCHVPCQSSDMTV